MLKCVPHVQHAYFLPFDQSNSSFLTSSFPLPSGMLELPNLDNDFDKNVTNLHI